MDTIELTELFLERHKVAKKLAFIDEQIKTAILERKESFSAADVKATYYKPSKTYDYQGAVEMYGAPEHIIKEHTVVKESVSWKNVCTDANITDIPSTEKPERVVVK